MIFTLVIAILTGIFVCLAVIFKPSIRIGKFTIGTYWMVSLIGAILILSFQLIPIEYVGNKFIDSSPVNPLKILLLFFSMTCLSIFLDELGFFQYLANKLLERQYKSQIGLFLMLYLVVSILTIFTSNDIIILTFTPFICCFAKRANINPLPYLFGEFFAANTWSMVLLIGNPTNIYLATTAGIPFFEYILHMIVPTVLAGVVSLGILILIFRKSLKQEIGYSETSALVLNKPLLIVGVIHLVACIILLSISSYIGLEMCYITLGFAASLILISIGFLIFSKRKQKYLVQSLKRLPYELIPFLLTMFVLVLALEYAGITEQIATILNKGNTIFTVGISSFFVSNLINNIPMSVLYGSILQSSCFTTSSYLGGVYAAIIGSNLGAYFTPVGALAGLMWISILKIYDVKISFKDFIKYGAITAIPTLLISLLGLWICML
ncbi:MAG: hypothetical protein K2N65_04365 [Anaeroplasmataceae bacterium]|nr:hypothetical protein [Anaeroplasmataceae bacterium]